MHVRVGQLEHHRTAREAGDHLPVPLHDRACPSSARADVVVLSAEVVHELLVALLRVHASSLRPDFEKPSVLERKEARSRSEAGPGAPALRSGSRPCRRGAACFGRHDQRFLNRPAAVRRRILGVEAGRDAAEVVGKAAARSVEVEVAQLLRRLAFRKAWTTSGGATTSEPAGEQAPPARRRARPSARRRARRRGRCGAGGRGGRRRRVPGPNRVHVDDSTSRSQRISTRRSSESPTTSPSPGTRRIGWPTSSSTAHSAYSFLDGASHPEELALRAAELGYEALALTDHEGVYGSLELAHAAKLVGVRPITGAEVTLVGGSHVTCSSSRPRGTRTSAGC